MSTEQKTAHPSRYLGGCECPQQHSRQLSPVISPPQKVYQIPHRTLMKGIGAGILGAAALAGTAYNIGKFGVKGLSNNIRNGITNACSKTYNGIVTTGRALYDIGNYGYRVGKAVYNTPFSNPARTQSTSIHKGTESAKNYPNTS